MGRDIKKSISLRLSVSDRYKIRRVADRLHVRESDVLRFSIKAMLERLAPLYDERARGAALMPVFIELGAELAEFFDLDRERLGLILDEYVDDPRERVDRLDVELLASVRGPDSYRRAKLREATELPDEDADTAKALRTYLYRKYIAGSTEDKRTHRSVRHEC